MTQSESPENAFHYIVARSSSPIAFDETNQEHWRTFVAHLESNGIDVGNNETLSLLLTHIGMGLRWVLEKQKDEIPPGYRKPEIGVEHPQSKRKAGKMFGYSREANLISVNPKTFKISHADPSKVLVTKNVAGSSRPGEETFVGRAPDLFFLEGIEEGDHSVWFKQYPQAKYTSDAQMTRAQYLSQPHELRALRLQLQASIECSMPQLTIDFLRKKLAEVMGME